MAGRAAPPYDAVLFDMDGVVLDSATLHAAAWKRLFDTVMADLRLGTGAPPDPFDPETDYRRYVDGRAREDGVAAFLAARGVAIPAGDPADPPEAWTVHGLAARKNELFSDLVAERGVRAFPGSVALLRRLRAGGVPIALVTASRNADALLASAGLGDLFDVVVDGEVAGSLGLHGKPEPDMFLEAARRLGVPPGRTAVVEDAVAGVEAARRGRIGFVVGIDRGGNRALLEASGADVVLGDVGELDLGSLRTDPWLVIYEGFDPAHEGHREALTTLGNGYMGTRGAAPEQHADGVHYPGSYLAGVYNRLISSVEGREVEDEHLVNVPNWLVFDLQIGDGPWWSDGGLEVRGERRELNLRRGLLTRSTMLIDSRGRRLSVVQRRLISMHRPHVAAMETTLVPEGWSGRIGIRSGVDVAVTNGNVAEYAGLSSHHLTPLAIDAPAPETLLVEVETSQSHIRIATALKNVASGPGRVARGETEHGGGRHLHRFDATLGDGEPLVIHKTVAVATSRDAAIASPRLGALTELERAPDDFAALLGEHEQAWARLWDRFAVDLEGDRQTRLVLNLHVFHLLQTISPHTAALDAGVTARGLHGEGYRGHVFWDELFVLPLVTLRLPEVTRALLDYRWRRLEAARRSASAAGLRGAMFPWQSGSDGREETPRHLYNLRSARWIPDNSRRQLHVGLAVAHNAWRYYQATGDVVWLAERGAELIIEVARLFASLAAHDPADDRFHIGGVMGPDEYHDGYPDAPGRGVRDNAYTNVLAAWVCDRAGDALAALTGHHCDDVRTRLHLGADEPSAWSRLARRLFVPFHDDGVISQFDGYAGLAEFDWSGYRDAYGNIERLDLILEGEDDSTNRYKVAKQADVLMLVYLLGPDGLVAQLERLGYETSPEAIGRTVDYYLARTAHGSTLSRVVHASVLARLDRSRAWAVFREALDADLDDTQGGTTREGVHLGAMAGTVDLILRSFAGLDIDRDALAFSPRLPEELRRAAFQVLYRGQRIQVSFDHERLELRAHACNAQAVRIRHSGKVLSLGGGETVSLPCGPPRPDVTTPEPDAARA